MQVPAWVSHPSTSSDFPDDARGQCLNFLDVSMRCSICYGIFDTPLMLRGCGHTFCSTCIRGSLDFQEKDGHPSCPGCRQGCDARDLLPCPSLREAADRYRAARDLVLQLLQAPTAPPPAPPPAPERSKLKRPGPGTQTRTRAGRHAAKQVVDRDAALDPATGPSSPIRCSSSGSEWSAGSALSTEDEDSPVKRKGSAKRKRPVSTPPPTPVTGEDADEVVIVDSGPEAGGQGSTVDDDSALPKGFVVCPICARRVPSFYINSHVDECLASGGAPTRKAPDAPPRAADACSAPAPGDSLAEDSGAGAAAFQPLPLPPKLVPNLVSDKTLRTLLRRVGLPAEGRRAGMARYARLRREVEVSNDRGEITTYERLARRVLQAERQVAAASLLSGASGEGGGGNAAPPRQRLVVDLVTPGADAGGRDAEAEAWRELVAVTRRRDAARKAVRAAGQRGAEDGAGSPQQHDASGCDAQQAAPAVQQELPSQPSPALDATAGVGGEPDAMPGSQTSQPRSCRAEMAGAGLSPDLSASYPCLSQPRREGGAE